ncbi:unnamed protein product [Didymodactylos carnosus]|uniref:Peptidase M13 N-terminal domain-containing protein n=1 Tax=Didymodactylos carnosus TaxID=1234261 RepID=A0A815GNA3_9BILA|nr:unnamed protein product [Didymodactylos carnosus]CAF4201510.1 unnamed protein product [Didymodactylos carnosus]
MSQQLSNLTSIRSLLFYNDIKETVNHLDINITATTTTPKVKKSSELVTCASDTCYNLSSTILSMINKDADPCRDFYEYSCGNYQTSDSQKFFDTAQKKLRSQLIDLFENYDRHHYQQPQQEQYEKTEKFRNIDYFKQHRHETSSFINDRSQDKNDMENYEQNINDNDYETEGTFDSTNKDDKHFRQFKHPSNDIIKKILEAPHLLFRSCMNERYIEELDITPLLIVMQDRKLHKWPIDRNENLTNYSYLHMATLPFFLDYSPLINVEIGTSSHDCQKRIITVQHGDSFLPVQYHLSSNDNQTKRFYHAYHNLIIDILKEFGLNNAQKRISVTDEIMKFEKIIAKLIHQTSYRYPIIVNDTNIQLNYTNRPMSVHNVTSTHEIILNDSNYTILKDDSNNISSKNAKKLTKFEHVMEF